MIIGHCALSQHIAKYAGEFLSIGVGGRAFGLGGAYSALANDALVAIEHVVTERRAL